MTEVVDVGGLVGTQQQKLVCIRVHVKLVASKLVSEGRKREPVSGKASVQKHAHLKGNFVEKQEIFHRLPARNVAGNNVKRTFKH